MSMLHAEGSERALRTSTPVMSPVTAETGVAVAPVPLGRIASLNRSPGGVPKLPVKEAHVTSRGLDGDRQSDLEHHGGPDRALSLYSRERIDALRAEGHPIEPGSVGENITLSGLDWATVVPGVRLRLGDVTAEVTAYAHPCTVIAGAFSDGVSTRISQKVHPGWSRVYARVVREGSLRVGDGVFRDDAVTLGAMELTAGV
jgi:MOSC domain-containing protein YiiM